jgi:hypothetical protein
VALVRVRRRGLRRTRGHRGAAGLRGRRDRALSALSPGWHELAAGRSGRADHARDPSRVGRVRRAGATWARDRHPNLDDTQRRDRLGGDALDGCEEIPCRTLVWTAGVRPSPIIARLGLPLDGRGRIETDEYLRVPGFSGVWAVGDAAAVPDSAAKGQRPTRRRRNTRCGRGGLPARTSQRPSGTGT